MIGLVGGPLDPGASVALTMADAMAAEDAYAAKRAEWIRRVRRGTGDVRPREQARSVRPELPGA